MTFTSQQIRTGNARLLRLAGILEGIPDPTAKMPDGYTVFDMTRYVHSCNAPACALGWWASHRKKGWILSKTCLWWQVWGRDPEEGAVAEFAITMDEAGELFTPYGCGNAGNDPKAAAAYIRDFVARRKAARVAANRFKPRAEVARGEG